MKHFILVTTLILIAIPCVAHDTFLLPREPKVRESEQMILYLTSGESFPNLESAIGSDRVKKGGWRTGNSKGKLDKWEDSTSALVMYLTPVGDGTSVMWLTLKPKSIDLDSGDVDAYFDEIGASDALRRDWADEGDDATFHETYTKHAKTYVRVGDADAADNSSLRPAGLAIELLPQSDPTALSVGDVLVIKAVRGGDDELEQFAVVSVCGTTGQSNMARTNEAGKVEIPITDAGWWMLRGTELRRKSDGTFESDFTTMTFYVEED